MGRSFFKWIIPGLLTVGGGTILAVLMTGARIESDLSTRTTEALRNQAMTWAGVTYDARDATLTGTAADQQAIDAAVSEILSVHGVRSVTAAVALAESVSPYPFAASIKDGAITLAGGVPNATMHAEILAQSGASLDQLRVLSGAPDLAAFRTAVDFVLAQVALLDDGQVTLAGLDISIAGRAKSSAAFDTLASTGENLPAGLHLAGLKIVPAAAANFDWQAEFDGHLLRLTGNSPGDVVTDELRAAAPPNVSVSTTLALASGEPEGFFTNALVLIKNLTSLESGSAHLTNGTITLTGAPPSPEVAAAVTSAIRAIGGTATLEPPRVANYSFVAEKSATGTKLSGYVPDAAILQALRARPETDGSALALARGAPQRFASGLEFGLGALAHLSEGRFSLAGTRLSLSGRAVDADGQKALETLLAEGPPQGTSLDSVDLHPPIADPFVWSAEKQAGGDFRLAGFVPSVPIQQRLAARIGLSLADATHLADGAPEGFEASALNGLSVLALLDVGTLTYDGTHWGIEGTVDSPKKGFAADAAYSVAGLRTLGWTYKVTLPVTVLAPPVVNPYVWRARKAADGAVDFTGFVPSEKVRQDLAKIGGAQLKDQTVPGAGDPANFAADAARGLAALSQLDEGTLGVTAEKWTLSGRAATSGLRQQIVADLAAAGNPANWQIDIVANDEPAAVTPYLWSATKFEDDTLALAGYVPDEATHQFIAVRAGTLGRDTITLASGEPPGFTDHITAGLEALTHLTSGVAAFDGARWTLSGIPNAAEDAAAATAALMAGEGGGDVWVTTLEAPTNTPPPAIIEPGPAAGAAPVVDVAPPIAPATTPAANLIFSATRQADGSTLLAGAIPAEAARNYVAAAAGASAENLTIQPSLPFDFIPEAVAGFKALAQLPDGQLGFDGTSWHLAGTADDATARAQLLAAIDAAGGGKNWAMALTVLPPVDFCRKRVDAVAARNGIVFKSGSATLAEASLPLLDELADDLKQCPDAVVHVEGHTDADGAEDLNLALSVARAEAVVNALIDRGVRLERLYADGYGESAPIASNDTEAGKQKNRRIAFSLSDRPN